MKQNIRKIAEGGMMIAIAIILSRITIFTLPNGGSVTLGSYVPLIIFALRYGVKDGVILGIIYGLFDCLLKPMIYHPVQFLLDYPLAFGCIGLAGLGKNTKTDQGLMNIRFFGAITLSLLMRAIAAVISGYVFFATYAPKGMHPLWYSIQYNALYIIPNILVTLVIITVLWKPFVRNIGR